MLSNNCTKNTYICKLSIYFPIAMTWVLILINIIHSHENMLSSFSVKKQFDNRVIRLLFLQSCKFSFPHHVNDLT